MVDAIGKPTARTGKEADLQDPKLTGKGGKGPPGAGPEVVVKTPARSEPLPEARGDAVRSDQEAEGLAHATAAAVLAAGPSAAELHKLQAERVEQLTADAA